MCEKCIRNIELICYNYITGMKLRISFTVGNNKINKLGSEKKKVQ